jgi:hypothetical protein
VSNPGFSGPFNYAIACNGPGSGSNSCGTTKHNGNLATSLSFDVLGGGGLLPLLVGSPATFFTVDILSALTGATGVIGANSFTLASSAIATTPLPPTLPLFAAGLGAIGLLGWRRKRKATLAG